jgi:MFS family permease
MNMEMVDGEVHNETISESVQLQQVNERILMRKIDLHVIPFVVLFYFLSFLDRTNIGNATLVGLTQDLNLTDYQYRIALTILYIPYILAEIPSNLIIKKVGPNYWLSILVILWGIVGTLQGIVTNARGLWIDRFFLGLTEGGILPGIILYLSAWYKPHELQFRIGLFWSASSLAGAFAGLLAAAIGLMDHVGGLHGWSWIFILEGIITVIIGINGFFLCLIPFRKPNF